MRKDIKLGFADYLNKPCVQGYVAPLQDYVSNQPSIVFLGRGGLKEYRYGNPYREFTVQGPNGPYIDCAYDGLFADIDEQVRTSIRLVKDDQNPVIQYSWGDIKVAGWPVENYPVHSTDGIRQWLEFEPKDHYLKPMEKFYHATYHDRMPDELELMYPQVMEPLNLLGDHPEWVWDAVEKQFPKYALANRPQPTVKRPYVNVGTIGHINYPTISVKPRGTKRSDWIFGMDTKVPFGNVGDF